MFLNEIIYQAASAYPGEAIMEQWDDKHECPANPQCGDILAQFIVHELEDTFQEGATDDEQVATAILVMQHATDELQAVIAALNVMAEEKRANTTSERKEKETI